MKIRKKVLASILAVIMVFSVLTPEAMAATKKITLKSGKAAPSTVYAGKTYALKVSGVTVRFYSSKKSIATIGMTTGKLKVKAPGKVKITAKSKKTGKVVATKTFTVNQRCKTVTANTESLALDVGEKSILKATKVPATSTDVVRFYSSNKKVVSVGSMSGKVTGISDGTATITVYAKATKSTKNSSTANKKATVKVTVTKNVVKVPSSPTPTQVPIIVDPTQPVVATSNPTPTPTPTPTPVYRYSVEKNPIDFSNPFLIDNHTLTYGGINQAYLSLIDAQGHELDYSKCTVSSSDNEVLQVEGTIITDENEDIHTINMVPMKEGNANVIVKDKESGAIITELPLTVQGPSVATTLCLDKVVVTTSNAIPSYIDRVVTITLLDQYNNTMEIEGLIEKTCLSKPTGVSVEDALAGVGLDGSYAYLDTTGMPTGTYRYRFTNSGVTADFTVQVKEPSVAGQITYDIGMSNIYDTSLQSYEEFRGGVEPIQLQMYAGGVLVNEVNTAAEKMETDFGASAYKLTQKSFKIFNIDNQDVTNQYLSDGGLHPLQISNDNIITKMPVGVYTLKCIYGYEIDGVAKQDIMINKQFSIEDHSSRFQFVMTSTETPQYQGILESAFDGMYKVHYGNRTYDSERARIQESSVVATPEDYMSVDQVFVKELSVLVPAFTDNNSYYTPMKVSYNKVIKKMK